MTTVVDGTALEDVLKQNEDLWRAIAKLRTDYGALRHDLEELQAQLRTAERRHNTLNSRFDSHEISGKRWAT